VQFLQVRSDDAYASSSKPMLNHLTTRNFTVPDADAVLNILTQRQHLHPHQPLREALEATIDELHCCPAAVERAMQWLQLDWNQPVGRLRRTELVQLARVIHRFWTQNNAQTQDQDSSV
jgi:hypothetical protein